jgi:drug/metabolite transporter (DMT)-like permease
VAQFLAILAAFAFAFGTVLQQKGTLEVPEDEAGRSFLTNIVRRPVWLGGALCMGLGWVLQAIALDKGPLVVVQSLTALSLVFALPIGARLTGQVVGFKVVAGAASMVAGIVLFLSVGSPTSGTSKPPAGAWLGSIAFTVAVVAIGFRIGRDRSGSARALLFGSAAGVCYAMQASVTKVFVPLVSKGLGTILSSWTTYALIASALVGLGLQQSALRTGVLAPAMASANALTLFFSVVFGITVFGETIAGGGRLGPAIFGLLLALLGIVLLAGAPPPEGVDIPAPQPPGLRT